MMNDDDREISPFQHMAISLGTNWDTTASSRCAGHVVESCNNGLPGVDGALSFMFAS